MTTNIENIFFSDLDESDLEALEASLIPFF